VTVTESQRWPLSSSFRQTARGPWGIAGVRETGTRPGERMVLDSTEDEGFSRAFVEVLRQPGGGRIDVAIDSVPAPPIATNAAEAAPGWVRIPVPAGSRELSLAPHGDGPVDVLAWGTERDSPGILYENFGTIGATVDIMGRWDPPIVQAELAERDPALIVIAFGTNEGFASATDPVAYKDLFLERVRMIKAAAPNAAILIIGPPDGNRLYRRGPGQAGACVAKISDEAPSAVSSQKPAKARSGSRTVWAPPPKLAALRAVQREAANEQGWYFWDWSAAMGGPCSMHRWASMDPPLAADDHVHLRQDGYRKTAEQLFAELMAQFDRYRALRPVTATAR
jgi:lysophospholipase L1-like esterase